jgi:hypothetical protein
VENCLLLIETVYNSCTAVNTQIEKVLCVVVVLQKKYIIMEAMNYEYLIRRVNQCGRHGVKGADADIYRRMERAETHLTNPYWNKTQEEKEHDYRISFTEVSRYVSKAIKNGIDQIEYRATEEEKDQLKKMVKEVDDFDFYNKKRIEEIIDSSDEIFRKHGLNMG